MKRRIPHLPSEQITAQIEKFSHDLRGIARIDGKVTFIQNALPGEKVTCQLLRKKRDFNEGVTLRVIEPSPHRVEPKCPHFAQCGGCSLQHLDESTQIHEKQALLLDSLAKIGQVTPEHVLPPLTASLWHYRNKARLSVRFSPKKESVLIGFREKNKPSFVADIQQCPVLNARFEAQLMPLRALLTSFDAPEAIAQIELAAGDDDVALIFRHQAPLSDASQEKLRQFSKATHFRVFLQSGGPDSVTLFYPPSDSDCLTYHFPEDNLTFQFHPTDFTQVNPGINRPMVQLARQLLALEPDDEVIDLYCGLGNFSLPLAKYCKHVMGLEGSETMVMRARLNAQLNGLTNTTFQCENLDDEGVLARLSQPRLTKMLLDPPRTGAKSIVTNLHHLKLNRIVYVSCNPATLARDAGILVHQQGFQLKCASVMDMFPHTQHVESIALFEKD